MSELSTLEPDEQTRGAASSGRPVRRRRGLPGGRAVIGAFLVAAAAVGIFGAYLSATAAPTTRYVVAARDLAIGTRLEPADVELVAMELPDAQADRAISEPEAALVDGLEGLVVLGPLTAGDLVMASQVVDDGDADGAVTMSFALPAERALAGRIRKGEAIDVIATFPGAGGKAYTEVVIRGATVFDVADAASSGVSGQARTFLVQVADLEAAQRLAYALDVADVQVARSGDPDAVTPDRYRPAEG